MRYHTDTLPDFKIVQQARHCDTLPTRREEQGQPKTITMVLLPSSAAATAKAKAWVAQQLQTDSYPLRSWRTD